MTKLAGKRAWITDGGTAKAVVLDVADAGSVAAAAKSIGPVDILQANARLNVPKRALGDLSGEDWNMVIDVNLNGVFYAVQNVLPGIRSKGAGAIILISNWAGRYATRLTGLGITQPNVRCWR